MHDWDKEDNSAGYSYSKQDVFKHIDEFGHKQVNSWNSDDHTRSYDQTNLDTFGEQTEKTSSIFWDSVFGGASGGKRSPW